MRARKRSRKAAERRGRWAESLAACCCRMRGFRVIARRYRTVEGEIDLVIRRRSLVAFVEVKARDTLDQALHALQPRQRMRLQRAAEAFLADHPIHAACSLRFDLIAVQPWRTPRWIADAWRADEAC